ncbi:hypothetical protein F7725_000118 [Dissostichus mawsoni]|uniref:Uncharacterized protein n=1 Tax=Dissostichus mawsoni TaxID=36200 RepID=A0A7J5ZE50_DISMA|nr:hypothetical protein F7725_000118 [Dissostichus mawsoni]
MDLEASATCPQEIADSKPAIVILIKKKEISAQLKQKCIELTNVHQYRCPPGSKSEPPARTRVDPPVNGTVLQRARCVIHALSRVDNNASSAYSGAQSCRHTPPNKSKPYYHTTYNEPPSKSVVYDIMVKLVEAMRKKNIPFSFLVGDLPTYKTIVQLKAENSKCTRTSSQFLALSISRCPTSMLSTRDSRDLAWQTLWSQQGDLLNKHYEGSTTGVRCILLWREVLIQQRLTNILEHEELSENIKENLNTLCNALTDTREALEAAHSNLEDDDGMKELITRVYEKPGRHGRLLDLIHGDSLTGLPYSCQPMDLWIETTMNLNSKLKQGWLQLLQNEKQLFSTTRNANNVARVKAALKRNLKCQRRHRKHVECQPARMRKDEQAVQDLQACMKF